MQECLCTNPLEWRERVRTFDCVRNYAAIMYQQQYHWNVFTEFATVMDVRIHSIDDIQPGEYYVSREFHLAHPSMKVKPGMYPSDFIMECISKEYLDPSLITKYLRADYHLPGDYFQEFIAHVYDLPDPKRIRHKQLVNFFLGGLCKFRNVTDHTFITDNTTVRDAAVNEYGDNISISPVNYWDEDHPIYLCHITESERMMHTAYPIARQVYCKSWLYLSDMWERVSKPETILISFKCDAVTVHNVKEDLCCLYEGTSKGLPDLGKIHEEEPHIHGKSNLRPIITRERQLELEDAVQRTILDLRPQWRHEYTRDTMPAPETLKGALITGPGGSGKSFIISELMRRFPNHWALCYQNVACANLRNATGSANVSTFDSYFQNRDIGGDLVSADDRKKRLLELSAYDVLFVDEFGQTPPHYFTFLYHAWMASNRRLRIFVAGDVNQTAYLTNSKEDFHYNYKETDLMKLICNETVITLDYINGVTRCDEPLREVLQFLLEEHRLHETLLDHKPNDEDEDKAYSICQTRTRGKHCVEQIHKRLNPTGLLGAGQEVICTVNVKDVATALHEGAVPDDCNVYNGNTYRILDVSEGKVRLEGTLALANKEIEVSRAFFSKKHPGKNMPSFEENRAQTVYRVQGQTLDEVSRPLIHIRDTNSMSLEEVYTALSRAKQLAQIRIDWTYRQLRRTKFDDRSVRVNIRNKKDLIQGKIYELIDRSLVPLNTIYVGMTTRTIIEEFQDIVDAATKTNAPTTRPILTYLREVVARGAANQVTVRLIEEYPCHKVSQLHEREVHYIAKRKRQGHPLKNSQNMSTENKKDELQKWTPIIDPTAYLQSQKMFDQFARELKKKSANMWTISPQSRGTSRLVATNRKRTLTFELTEGIELEHAVKKLYQRVVQDCEQRGEEAPQFRTPKKHARIADLLNDL